MPQILYESKSFREGSLRVIDQANTICAEYQAQGFDLTLRQLYYQFVARGLLPNTDRDYKRLGSIVNDGRMAGLIDWNYIVDRTRGLRGGGGFETPDGFVQSMLGAYGEDLWRDQPEYVEVWIEKDALVGVIERVCNTNNVPYFSCRGYSSQSEMWRAGRRIKREGKPATILHLGDHDPSGLDMTRDIQERLWTFTEFVGNIHVERIALTMDQVREFNPPPNPAKITDSRAAGYIAEYGDESWELDALDPASMADLIETSIEAHRDPELWNAAIDHEETNRRRLTDIADRWDDVVAYLDDHPNGETP